MNKKILSPVPLRQCAAHLSVSLSYLDKVKNFQRTGVNAMILRARMILELGSILTFNFLQNGTDQ